MPSFSQFVDSLTGAGARDAARAGAKELQAGFEEGAEFRVEGGEAGLQALRDRLGSFADAFSPEQIQSLTGLATDPAQQAEFLQGNPFFDALRSGAREDTFRTQSARGGLGGSGTDEILQNKFLSIGNSYQLA